MCVGARSASSHSREIPTPSSFLSLKLSFSFSLLPNPFAEGYFTITRRPPQRTCRRESSPVCSARSRPRRGPIYAHIVLLYPVHPCFLHRAFPTARSASSVDLDRPFFFSNYALLFEHEKCMKIPAPGAYVYPEPSAPYPSVPSRLAISTVHSNFVLSVWALLKGQNV